MPMISNEGSSLLYKEDCMNDCFFWVGSDDFVVLRLIVTEEWGLWLGRWYLILDRFPCLGRLKVVITFILSL